MWRSVACGLKHEKIAAVERNDLITNLTWKTPQIVIFRWPRAWATNHQPFSWPYKPLDKKRMMKKLQTIDQLYETHLSDLGIIPVWLVKLIYVWREEILLLFLLTHSCDLTSSLRHTFRTSGSCCLDVLISGWCCFSGYCGWLESN